MVNELERAKEEIREKAKAAWKAGDKDLEKKLWRDYNEIFKAIRSGATSLEGLDLSANKERDTTVLMETPSHQKNEKVNKIIVGRGGNQKEKIIDEHVGPCHCIIMEHGNNNFSLKITNFRPTIVDSERIYEDSYFNGDSIIKIGETKEKIKNMMIPYDVTQITDWGVALQRFDRAIDAEAFRRVSLLQYDLEDSKRIKINCDLKGCQAYHLIQENKLREAQILIYEAGDALYDAQNGSQELKDSYGALMALLYYLYERANLTYEAQETKQCFAKLQKSGIECSEIVLHLIK